MAAFSKRALDAKASAERERERKVKVALLYLGHFVLGSRVTQWGRPADASSRQRLGGGAKPLQARPNALDSVGRGQLDGALRDVRCRSARDCSSVVGLAQSPAPRSACAFALFALQQKQLAQVNDRLRGSGRGVGVCVWVRRIREDSFRPPELSRRGHVHVLLLPFANARLYAPRDGTW